MAVFVAVIISTRLARFLAHRVVHRKKSRRDGKTVADNAPADVSGAWIDIDMRLLFFFLHCSLLWVLSLRASLLLKEALITLSYPFLFTSCIMFLGRALTIALAATSVSSFAILPSTTTSRGTALFAADAWSGAQSSSSGVGSIEQIEFKIHPDGRVEETVRGVKGNNCHKVTEAINEKLGEVVASSPTEEMFESEVSVNEQVTISDSSSSSSNNWDGSSSW